MPMPFADVPNIAPIALAVHVTRCRTCVMRRSHSVGTPLAFVHTRALDAATQWVQCTIHGATHKAFGLLSNWP